MTRYLAVDLGDRRTGLAMGDDQTGFVSPGEVLQIPIGPRLTEALARAAEEADADAIVMGLPLHMDDSESARSKLTRAEAQVLADAAGRPVHLQDERLTSFAANQRMARSGRTRGQKKKIRDALAAAELLRDFLDAGGGFEPPIMPRPDGPLAVGPPADGPPTTGPQSDGPPSDGSPPDSPPADGPPSDGPPPEEPPAVLPT
ncbi:MAG: Holliday junction resolvase RuvX [Phycisphaerales bacterium]